MIFYPGICCYNSAPMKHPLSILLLMLLLPAPRLAAEDAIVVRTSPLYDEPSYGAGRVGQVGAGTAVTVEARRGGWKKVVSEAASVEGWLRSHQVRDAATTPTVKVSDSDSRGFLAGLASLSRKASSFFRSDSRRGSSGTATIGVRGLSEAEIKGAQADFEELEKMHLFASSRQRSTDFASEGGLDAVAVPYLAGREK